MLGYYDKMQNLDFGPTHKIGGAKYCIDFCFLKFFISIKKTSQGQKMIFCQFELCGQLTCPLELTKALYPQ